MPGEIEREDIAVTEHDGDAVLKVKDAEIRLTVRSETRELSVELDHYEHPYWLIVDEDEDEATGIVGEIEPSFAPAKDGDSQ